MLTRGPCCWAVRDRQPVLSSGFLFASGNKFVEYLQAFFDAQDAFDKASHLTKNKFEKLMAGKSPLHYSIASGTDEPVRSLMPVDLGWISGGERHRT